MVSERASERAFFGVSALLFVASAAGTIVWCVSMSAMGEMPMPGGWTMSMLPHGVKHENEETCARAIWRINSYTNC
jgi:hypothetical protein